MHSCFLKGLALSVCVCVRTCMVCVDSGLSGIVVLQVSRIGAWQLTGLRRKCLPCSGSKAGANPRPHRVHRVWDKCRCVLGLWESAFNFRLRVLRRLLRCGRVQVTRPNASAVPWSSLGASGEWQRHFRRRSLSRPDPFLLVLVSSCHLLFGLLFPSGQVVSGCPSCAGHSHALVCL